ncbi:MAG: ABC transporter ATP-binding protein [Sulfobacillus sp.]
MNDTEPSVVIEAKGLMRQHGQGDAAVQAINGIDLVVKQGEMVALMGPSGSGKSTLMQILGLLDRPTKGSYHLAGKDVSRLSKGEAARLRGRRIAFVFQGIHLLPRLSAIRNVELPMVYARFSADERLRRATESLSRVGLAHLAARRPAQLSGGQAQRIAIARAVAPGPDLLLADEPTGALDRASGRAVLALFQELNRDLGLTIVIVTHDPLVGRHAKRIVELEDGRVITDRPVDDRILAQNATEVGA